MEIKMPCEIYSRVTGYVRPTNCWNKGKTQEFHDRKEYIIENAKKV
jgi:ribonucleoside-triphosphate reductase